MHEKAQIVRTDPNLAPRALMGDPFCCLDNDNHRSIVSAIGPDEDPVAQGQTAGER